MSARKELTLLPASAGTIMRTVSGVCEVQPRKESSAVESEQDLLGYDFVALDGRVDIVHEHVKSNDPIRALDLQGCSQIRERCARLLRYKHAPRR